MIQFLTEEVSLPSVITDKISFWIVEVIRSYNYDVGTINYLFCNDDYILQINKNYLEHDYYTDIITFDYCSTKVISGDLVISLDTVATNSKLFSTEFDKELCRVIIHGVLHLIGFKDSNDEEKQQMRDSEDDALKLLSTFR